MSLVWFVFGVVAWGALVLFLRAYRIWLPYYIIATVGLAYGLILLVGSFLGLEMTLAHSVAWTVHLLCESIGIPTRIFRGAPGVLLVLVIEQDVGWTMLRIGVESSGLLELSVLASLLVFYPGWSLPRRTWYLTLGLVATWAANIVRVLLIVVILHYMGKSWLVLAHTYLGKLVFFVCIVAIFWWLITRVSIEDLHQRQQEALQARQAS